MMINIEILSNGFVVSAASDVDNMCESSVFISKREALQHIADLMPDIEVENAKETLRLRRKELDGKSLYDQYLNEAMRLQAPIQDVLRCFDNIITMSACTGISERAIRNYLHYNAKTPSKKTLTRATRWLRNPTFVGEVQDDE